MEYRSRNVVHGITSVSTARKYRMEGKANFLETAMRPANDRGKVFQNPTIRCIAVTAVPIMHPRRCGRVRYIQTPKYCTTVGFQRVSPKAGVSSLSSRTENRQIFSQFTLRVVQRGVIKNNILNNPGSRLLQWGP